MAPLRSLTCTALLLLAAVAPASAWTLAAPTPVQPDAQQAAIAAWTTDLSPSAFPGDAVAAVQGAAACALGDVTGDGIADLAVLVESAGGQVQLEARAGPDFEEVVWQLQTSLERVMTCAPDLDLDGTLDPIIRTLGEVQGQGGAAADQARSIVQQTLDGASGAALVGRVDTETVTGAAAGGVGAAQQATSILLPAAEGAVAVLQGTSSQALAGLPIPSPDSLPVALPVPIPTDLTVVASQAVQLDILDISGAVVATVEVAEAGVQPLALAPVQLSGALPDVAVLSQVTGPVREAAGGVPELALYAADGTLAWATQLPATTGLPILVPNAGDLDLDGVGDLIVTTVTQPLEAAPGATYTVLSGVDGAILFTSGPAVSGLLAALPLGQLPDGPALLEASLADGATSLTLQALGATGSVLWSVDVDRLAFPVNTVLDPYTQDLLGFTDLTGDGIPDVAVASNLTDGSGGLHLQAIDGVTGDLAWEADIPQAQEVVPVVIGLSQVAEGAAGDVAGNVTEVADLPGLEGATDAVQEATTGTASALLAKGSSQANATLTLIDGLTGEVAWTSTADLGGVPLTELGAQVAGDLDGDQVQDLLVTAERTVNDAAGSGQRWTTASTGSPSTATAVSGATGQTIWTEGTRNSGDGSGLEFESELGPASDDAEEVSGNDTPALGPIAVLAAFVLVAFARRRRDLP